MAMDRVDGKKTIYYFIISIVLLFATVRHLAYADLLPRRHRLIINTVTVRQKVTHHRRRKRGGGLPPSFKLVDIPSPTIPTVYTLQYILQYCRCCSSFVSTTEQENKEITFLLFKKNVAPQVRTSSYAYAHLLVRSSVTVASGPGLFFHLEYR